MYSGIFDDLIRIMRETAKFEALAKIHRRAARNAAIGMHQKDIVRSHLNAVRNKYNTQRQQITNQRMSLWRTRNRTTK